MCVGIDQSRNDGLAGEVDLLGAPRHRNLVYPRDGFDVAVADDDQRVTLGISAPAVDQCGALERDDVIAGETQPIPYLAACGDRQQRERDGRMAANHLGSAEV